ncbi:hypothetical protein [Romboutsia sp.]|uniref:hypothetical protein n=1 Tax=Romboutsia sp. TaxID=1965302 RepID=UPI002B570F7C|nr:hypothetical protein [Romboutsia sp.]HSQ87826.1 hypothetical protein [Romboutsia sp.]
MNKYVDFIAALTLSCFAFLMWKLKALFAATPENFYFQISLLILFNLGIFASIYCSYLAKTNLILVNLILVFLLLSSWFLSTKTSFTHNHNIVDAIITFLCFMIAMIQFVCIIINGINKHKKISSL